MAVKKIKIVPGTTNFPIDLKLFLMPTAYFLILYLIWRLEKITLDLFLISVGLGFFALLLFECQRASVVLYTNEINRISKKYYIYRFLHFVEKN